MNQQFYIVTNGKQEGPFTIEELKSKSIQKNTLVWTEGMDNWTKAEYIPVLKDVIKATPPPIPSNEEQSNSQHVPPVPNYSNNNHFGYELARRRDRFFACLLESIIIYVPSLLIYTLLFDRNYLDEDYTYFSAQSIKETFGQAVFSGILGAIFYPMWSSNLGHKIMGLKVISSIDGKDKNNAVDGALREGLKTILSLLIFPIIWLLWDDKRQNLYDKVLKTYVVKK